MAERRGLVEVPGPEQRVPRRDPPPLPRARRRASRCCVPQRHQDRRPSMVSTRGTSKWPKPLGRDSGGWISQVARSALRACPITPRLSGSPSRARAVISMCQPSPPGSASTTGRARPRWPGRPSSFSYQRGSASTAGVAPTALHVSDRPRRPGRCAGSSPVRRAAGPYRTGATSRPARAPPIRSTRPGRPRRRDRRVPGRRAAAPSGADPPRRRGRWTPGRAAGPDLPARARRAGRTGGARRRRRRRASCPRSSDRAVGASALHPRGVESALISPQVGASRWKHHEPARAVPSGDSGGGED